jgi:hypothetical protein
MELMKTAQFCTCIDIKHESLGISDGIATGYELNGRCSVPGRNKKSLLFSTTFLPALGLTQPHMH